MIIQIEVTSKQPNEFTYDQIIREFSETIQTCQTLYKTFNGEPIRMKMKIL
jgi:hypothetical protein